MIVTSTPVLHVKAPIEWRTMPVLSTEPLERSLRMTNLSVSLVIQHAPYVRTAPYTVVPNATTGTTAGSKPTYEKISVPQVTLQTQ